MDVLLTNDDGIESVGLHVLYEALSTVGTVHVVAPREDQSAIGRALSNEVQIDAHDIGYAVAGTPSDCVVAGLEAIVPDPDLVVAGCNKGANLGTYVLGRSGTVSAAVEAAFFGVPAIAVSLYIPRGSYPFHPEPEEFTHAVAATTFLADRARSSGVFDQADYLNLNAPPPGMGAARMVVTTPAPGHHMEAVQHEDGRVALQDRVWERMREDTFDPPTGTDRHAVVQGNVSVSPLSLPHPTTPHEPLEHLASEYRTP